MAGYAVKCWYCEGIGRPRFTDGKEFVCWRCGGKGVVMEAAKSWECGLRKIEQGEKTWRRIDNGRRITKIYGRQVAAPDDPRQRIATKIDAMLGELVSAIQELDAHSTASRNIRQAAIFLRTAHRNLSE